MSKQLRPIETITLDRVRLYAESYVDVEIAKLIEVSNPHAMQRLAHEDMCARRHILSAFGKTETFEFRCPETWWQHVKLAARERWPRLFKRIVVRYRVARVDSGAVALGLPKPTASRYTFIPYVMPVSHFGEHDGPSDDEP